jgi:orotate phosphoribosyltransferase
VDDVITAGTAVRETLDIIKSQCAATVCAIIVSVDRMERGSGNTSAVQEIINAHGIPVHPIVTISHIIEYLKTTSNKQHGVDSAFVAKIEAYLEQYRAREEK